MEEGKNVWMWVLVAIALLFLFGSFGMGGYGMMGFGMGYGFLVMLLFLGAIIWLVVTLIDAAQGQKGKDTAWSILKRRYTSGEVSKKQYEEMKKELER